TVEHVRSGCQNASGPQPFVREPPGEAFTRLHSTPGGCKTALLPGRDQRGHLRRGPGARIGAERVIRGRPAPWRPATGPLGRGADGPETTKGPDRVVGAFRGGRCRIRTYVGLRRRIYSPLPLAARAICRAYRFPNPSSALSSRARRTARWVQA